MVDRKAYYRAAAETKGRFKTRAELISYLACQLAGERTYSDIAAGAGIAVSTLTSLIKKGKIPEFQGLVPNKVA